MDLVVHYDLPASMNALQQRIGRFNRIGRKHELRMVAFRDESAAIPSEAEALDAVLQRETEGPLGSEAPEGE